MPKKSMFPLEAVAVYVGEDKLSSDMSKYVRLHVHRHIAKEVFESSASWTKGNLKR